MNEILLKEISKGKKMATSVTCKKCNDVLQELRGYFNANGAGISLEILDKDTNDLFQRVLELENAKAKD